MPKAMHLNRKMVAIYYKVNIMLVLQHAGGMFASAAAFGQSAASNLFGSSQPASGGAFGNSQAAFGGGFGASQPASAAFGGGFGASQPAPGLFGTPQSTPAGYARTLSVYDGCAGRSEEPLQLKCSSCFPIALSSQPQGPDIKCPCVVK